MAATTVPDTEIPSNQPSPATERTVLLRTSSATSGTGYESDGESPPQVGVNL